MIIRNLIKEGYLEAFWTNNSSDLQGFLFQLHRSLRRKGKLEISEYKGYTFKVLSFKEMAEGSTLTVFIIADHLFCPNSFARIEKETGYKRSSVSHNLLALKKLGLLKKEGERYVLRGTQEQLLEFYRNSSQCKLRKVERIRLYVKAMELTTKGFSRKEIFRRTGVSNQRIGYWQDGIMQPRLKLQTCELFIKQGLISDSELEIWKKIGVCETTKRE